MCLLLSSSVATNWVALFNERQKPQKWRTMGQHRLLRYFEYAHLPEHLQPASKACAVLAHTIAEDPTVVDGAEQTVALRKLLEAKDAYVRSRLPEQS